MDGLIVRGVRLRMRENRVKQLWEIPIDPSGYGVAHARVTRIHPSPYPSKLYRARNEFGTTDPITWTGSGILPALTISKIHDKS